MEPILYSNINGKDFTPPRNKLPEYSGIGDWDGFIVRMWWHKWLWYFFGKFTRLFFISIIMYYKTVLVLYLLHAFTDQFLNWIHKNKI